MSVGEHLNNVLDIKEG